MSLKQKNSPAATALRQLLSLCTLLCGVLLSTTVMAHNASNKQIAETTTATISSEIVKKRLEAIQADTTLDKDTIANLESLHRKTISNIESTASYEKSTREFIDLKDRAPALARDVKQLTAREIKVDPVKKLGVSTADSLEKIEAMLLKEKADLSAVEANLTRARERLKHHNARPQIIRQRLIEANREAEGIAGQIQQKEDTAELPALLEAKHWEKLTAARMLSAEIKMLDNELLSHPMRIELYEAEAGKAEHSVSYVKKRVDFLEELVNQKRRVQAREVEVAVEKMQEQVEGQHPLVKQLAENNAELSRHINEMTASLQEISAAEKKAHERVKRIDQDYKNAKQKFEVAGMSKVLGRLLQDQRRELPDTRVYRKKSDLLEDKIADVSLQQLELKEERDTLRETDVFVRDYLVELTQEEQEKLWEPISKLAKDRLGYLDQVISIQDSYIRAMSELDFSHTRLLEAARVYDNFLAERLLWVRSARPVSLSNFGELAGQFQDLLRPANWLDVIDSLLQQKKNYIYLFLTLVMFTVLIWKNRTMRALLQTTGKYVGKPSKDSIKYTLQGLQWTLLLALAWPLLMASIGWQLQQSVSASPFTKAVSVALILVAEGLFILRAFRVLCARHGVAAVHFKWPEKSLNLLRRDINILIYTFLPLGFISIIVINSEISEQGVGLGRLAFILMMIALAVFFFRVLNPSRGALQEFFVRQKRPAMTGIRYAWLILVVLLPIASAVLAMAGYLYTAGTLVRSLVETLWLLLGLITLQQFVVRWLLVIRGQLILKEMHKTREAARQASTGEENSMQKSSALQTEISDTPIDINTLSEDSLKLLNLAMLALGAIGVWLVWADVFPALGIFENFTLYEHDAYIEGVISSQPVTLSDLGQVILTLVVLTLLIKRLPAFLEILLRQRSSISPGSLYAIKSLSIYALIGVGVVVIFSALGGTWKEIQWIFAALGVGIGFGLQEIVANFISGLIILFERPIRVGDVVTVGDVSGTVTKIRIRATTIRDWDRKELLVPNKEFITSRLLNWTLSDTVARLLVPVGIAYGSDVELAKKLILESADECEKIIDDPAPTVTFDEFGDNALTLTARVFIDNIDYRVTAASELHSLINDKFIKAGIVIAFPQRDVHLDTTQPLEIRINK